jgi:hypothetical protein
MSKLSEWEGLVKSIHDSGMAWVEAKLKAEQLEEDCKPFLDAIKNEIQGNGNYTESRLEREARGSKQYRDYIIGMCAARAAALKAKVRYESWQNLFEARRTEAATERVKIEKGIYHEGR